MTIGIQIQISIRIHEPSKYERGCIQQKEWNNNGNKYSKSNPLLVLHYNCEQNNNNTNINTIRTVTVQINTINVIERKEIYNENEK